MKTKIKETAAVIRTPAANKNLDYYLSLPYVVETFRIPEEEGGGYVACIPVLGRWSAVGDGETPEEAYRNLYEALPSLVAEWLEDGVMIPEPKQEEELPSGILSLRLPKSLHAHILREKEIEGVSINAYIVNVLSQAVASASTLRYLNDYIESHSVAMKVTTISSGHDVTGYRFEENDRETPVGAFRSSFDKTIAKPDQRPVAKQITTRLRDPRCASA